MSHTPQAHPLAAQTTEAMWALLRGLQHTDEASSGALLRAVSLADLHAGLLTTVLRLIVLLYAEGRDLMTARDACAVTSLFERLQSDAAQDPDAMAARHGAWTHLSTLFQRIHRSTQHPPGHSQLFDPDTHPFLEGCTRSHRVPPQISDACVLRVLCALLVVRHDGAPIAYDSLDVEHLGEAYEAMLGFTIVRAGGPSIALKPRGITIRLDDLLAVPPAKRRAWLQRSAACRLSIAEHRALLQANAPAAAAEALKQKTSPHTPRPLPAGSLLLQPTEARRRSGSHYTPRELTTPIVETALRPVLERLGPNPTPAQLLSLKVCDPAMGAGAFLLEACRQLARHLTRAGQQHGTPVTDARRLVAQHCLYGVDKNPVAAQLAKLSLWMMAGSSQLPFTFADHALKHGDSLVGLGREQLGEAAIASARLKGDLLVSVRFAEKNAAARAARREECLGWWQAGELEKVHAAVATLRETVVPLHWEVEFPDVFGRDTPGFDVIVGNPPFLGGGRISQTMGAAYLDVLRGAFHGAGGQADLVAYFFRRACQLAAPGGCIGFVATNTLAQGDTRQAGLQHICQHGGTIYSAVRRLWWPGTAAVVVSVVHICWKPPAPLRDVRLDGQAVGRISAFLCHTGGDEAPRPLRANAGLSFKGSLVYGMGFIFDDRDDKGRTSSVEEMRCLVARDPRNAERIFPYIGGHEVNWSPTHTPHRYVINFGDLSEAEARQWPDLMAIVEQKVKPERMKNRRALRRRYWWRFGETTPALFRALSGRQRVIVNSQISTRVQFALVRADMVFSHGLNVFPLEQLSAFAVLQSRPHELWANFFGSSMKDDLRYTPSRCFETFPFPEGWRSDGPLERAGTETHDYRARLMADPALRAEVMEEAPPQGMTQTYNRLHDPRCTLPGIVRLRQLHDEMDRAVLDAYGWGDLQPRCAFLPDAKGTSVSYRWPDAVQDAVLGRLIALSQHRHAAEVATGTHRDGG